MGKVIEFKAPFQCMATKNISMGDCRYCCWTGCERNPHNPPEVQAMLLDQRLDKYRKVKKWKTWP